MIVCVIWILMLARSHGKSTETKLTVLQERVLLLERRLSEDISLLRKEFYTELNSAPETYNAEKEQGGVGARISNNVDGEFVKTFEDTVSQLFDQIKVLKVGFSEEKRIRRNIEHALKLEQHKTNGIVDFLNEIGLNITRNHDGNTIRAILTQLEEISEILNEIKTDQSRATEALVNKLNERENDSSKKSRATDCSDLMRQGHMTSGVYEIRPASLWRPLLVYCDMTTDGGGWTVFQRRCDGSEDFYRPWNDYRFGFGNLSAEFWLGNEYLYRIMSSAPQEMRIELEDFDNDRRYAKYALFEIKSADDLFQLHVEDFTGNVTDSLIATHNNRQFSTRDKGPSSSCSISYKGGFWYNSCHAVNINGKYLKGEHESYADGVNWKEFRGYHYSLKFTEMKFRSK